MFQTLVVLLLLAFTLNAKEAENYRQFDASTPEHVKTFYRINHTQQTLKFVLQKKEQYCSLKKGKLGVWKAIELLDTLVDESDPDINLPQTMHLFQTAEAMRKDGQPRWFILTGLIHDLGKILSLYGEPQWAVVGDTFPCGCAFSEKVVFSNYFSDNPDSQVKAFQSPCGIYSEGCGLDQVHMAWGHDEYLYWVVKDYLPEEASYIIRYHSFYPHHRERAYDHLLSEKDRKMLPWLQLFSKYDLYSKAPDEVDIEALTNYYQELVSEFFPEVIDW